MSSSVYVTGIGVVSPAGLDAAQSWRTLLAGDRMVQEVPWPSATGGGGISAGVIPLFSPPAGMESADRVCQLAVAVAREAAVAAGLDGAHGPPLDPARLGVSFGTSKGGIATFSRLAGVRPWILKDLTRSTKHLKDLRASYKSYLLKESYPTFNTTKDGIENYPLEPHDRSYRSHTPLWDIPPDAPARYVAELLGAGAGMHATVAACATGTLALIRGVQMLVDGEADAVMTGAADASILPLWVAAFQRMGVLAQAHPLRGAAWACRPFDRTRSGFVIGEGAAALVLETQASAARRGVRPLARVLGYALGTDPAGLAQIEPHGAPLTEIIKIACTRAKISPDHLAAVQAHGTGTRTNDAAEAAAIHSALASASRKIPVVSIKGAIGHLLGAAGAVELAATVQTIQHGVLPPNATLIEADTHLGGGLCLPDRAVSLTGGPILKTSMGFGGHVAAVIIGSP